MVKMLFDTSSHEETLMQSLIELTTQEGQIVLDPFCGSGSTLIAAKLLGRNFIGFESNKEYSAIAEERLTNKCNQAQLFDETA